MKDWNVIVTVGEPSGFRAAHRLLRQLGDIEPTGYYNVLAMRVADVEAFTQALEGMLRQDRSLLDIVSRIAPAQATFDFTTAEDFEAKARAIVLGWADRLAGKTFHVRMHRRGHKSELRSGAEEHLLDDAVLERTAELGHPARMSFADPDLVIDVETLGSRAGLSLRTRADLRRLPFLRVD